MLIIVKDDNALRVEAANIVVNRINKKPNLVQGLAIDGTPLGLYKELIRMHRKAIIIVDKEAASDLSPEFIYYR